MNKHKNEALDRLVDQFAIHEETTEDSISLVDGKPLVTKLAESKVHLNTEVSALEPILSIKRNNKSYSFLNAGGLSLLIAFFKGGKSFLSILIALLASKRVVHEFFESFLAEDTLIILFDTEEGRRRSQLKVNKYFGQNSNIKIDLYSMRHLDNVDVFALTKLCIRRHRPKFLLIDIGSDLVSNVNDIEQANYITNRLAAYAEQFNMHIMMSLHLARSTKQAIGHIGSAMLKRSEVSLRVTKIGQNFRVDPEFTRDEPFPTFWFEIKDGMPTIIDEDPSHPDENRIGGPRRKSDFTRVPTETHLEVLRKVFVDANDGLPPKQFKPLLQKHYSEIVDELGLLLVRELQRFYVESGLLVKQKGKLMMKLEPSETNMVDLV